MTKVAQAAGGGRRVEVSPDRIVGWVNRFAARNEGIAAIDGALASVTITGGNGTRAALAVPYPPMNPAVCDGEPVAALLDHIDRLGVCAVILMRGGAYSFGLARAGQVLTSSTDSRYLQSRTAAGGWSQQRYARRRGNQRRDAHRAAARTVHRVLGGSSYPVELVATGGEARAIAEILDDPALSILRELPRRHFPDTKEPRRAVLDEVAARALAVSITITDGDAMSGT